MEVINHNLFGNTLIAKRAFAPGELFLREAPLIVCKDTNAANATFAQQLPAVRDAYLSASPEVQQKIMAMMWCAVMFIIFAIPGKRSRSHTLVHVIALTLITAQQRSCASSSASFCEI